MSIRIPPHIETLRTYVPGKPVKEVERELGLTETVKMASNENPLGPSPKAVEAVRNLLPELHLYPEGGGYYLRRALSRFYGAGLDEIVIGNGSVEIIEIAAKALCGPGRSAVISEGSFGMFSIAVQAMNAPCHAAPMKNRTHDLDAMLDAVDPDTHLIIIANPNNPTGTYVPLADLEGFLERVPPEVLVIVDEAYKEFVTEEDYGTAQPLLERFPNLMVLGTFSKLYGLAGVRIGYGLAQAGTVAHLNKVRSPFNTTSPAQVAAIAALDDQEFALQYLELNRRESAYVCSELEGMGLAVTPTVANFVLVDVPMPGKEFFDRLLREGIIVRPMAGWGFPRSVRVSFHLREGNDRFLEAARKVLGR